MDSPKLSQGAKKGSQYILLRFSFALLVSLIASGFLSFVTGFVAVLIRNYSVSSPNSVAAECKIVSSSSTVVHDGVRCVDLRSSKVCELGWLNYKAKHVFYPLERRKFRCHYDYYWASIFQVEYKEHSSGQTHHALAEAPREALPLDCRPSFGTAWLAKYKFKVNETYNCWYTPGISKVDMYSDSLFNCQAKDPSVVEMIRRFSILVTRIKDSWPTNQGRAKHVCRDAVIGVIAGVSTSLISVSFVRLLYALISRQARSWQVRKRHFAAYGVCFKRACFLVAYVSFMGWLIIQYGKMLGIPKIFIKS